jgi:hypothetical protein
MRRARAHPLLRLTLFRIRTFRAAVSGSFFTRLGIGGIPFLFPLLYQVGLGFSPIQSGLLMMPQAIAAMSLKMTMPAVLARFGYRGVLISNTVILGLLILLFATIGAGTPVWLIVAQAFSFGFFTSLQYTSMNTLVYADVTEHRPPAPAPSPAPCSRCRSALAWHRPRWSPRSLFPTAFTRARAKMIHGIHEAFLILGAMTIVSAIVFRELQSNDGSSVSQHKAILPAG